MAVIEKIKDFIHLKSLLQREGDSAQERSLTCGFTHQLGALSRATIPCQNQELGDFSRSLTWVVEAQTPGLSSFEFPKILIRNWVKSRASKT